MLVRAFVGWVERQRNPTFDVGLHYVPPNLQENGEGIEFRNPVF
ncbi:MAG: hypothetical protein SXA11_01105 [Cyanobacteriota bacterium]|nr:hypothetical protein [Cyanobacteriota bacterium]